MDRPWYAHYDPGVPHQLDYPEITLPELFRRVAGERPERIGTVFHDRKTSYASLQRQIETFAAALRARGIRPRDRVAIMLPNIPQFVTAFFGTLRAGAIAVPTNPLYTQHELEYQLADAGASAAVTIDALFPRLQAALPATPVRLVIVASIGAALPLHLAPLFALKERRAGRKPVRPGGIVERFESMLAHKELTPEPLGTPDDTAVLQYTGGTTGYSKGAMLSHRNLIANAMQAHAWQGASLEPDLRVLCAIPFFHVYGLTIAMNMSVVSAATMLLVPRFIPKDVASVARKYRPQVFPGVPTMYVALPQMAGKPERSFSSLQVCMSGAAPLMPDVQHRFESMSGARVVEGYGLSEAGPVTHCNPILGDRRVGTVGIPFPDTDAMITDPETWEPLRAGEIGEMTVAGPQVMTGYWNRPEETLAILRNGWLHTGDMATMTADGYFQVVDRKKDIIIASGYNVYPREVEEVLLAHPKITDAAVFGVPSEYRGETVKAVVVLHEDQTLTAEEVIAYCKEELAAYKVPKAVEMRDELPKTLIGKVLRRQLREEHAASADSSARAAATRAH